MKMQESLTSIYACLCIGKWLFRYLSFKSIISTKSFHLNIHVEHVASQQSQSLGAIHAMAQYFLALFFLCLPDGSMGTTTKPQQQSSGALKDLCEVSAIL